VICGGLLSDLLAWPRADEIIAPQTEPRALFNGELIGPDGKSSRNAAAASRSNPLSLFKQTTFDKTHPRPQSRQLFFPADLGASFFLACADLFILFF
jgi:hypothetical protein